MRYSQIILEYDRSITLQKYNAKLLSALNADSNFLSNSTSLTDDTKLSKLIAAIEAMDPTKNKQFVVWLVNQYIKGQYRIEDAPRVVDTLSNFVTTDIKRDFKRRQLPLDINRFDFHTLRKEIMNFKTAGFDNSPDTQSTVNYKHANNITVLYNGPLGQLLVPKSAEASQEIGANTEWCTAYPGIRCMFDRYNDKGPLFVWIDSDGNKFQFHFEDTQFKDKDDFDIDSSILHKFRNNHPVLSKLFKSREKTMLAKKDLAVVYNYIKNVIKDRWPEAEPFLFADDKYGTQYIHLIKKPMPEIEQQIAKNATLAYQYASTVLKRRWPEAEPALVQSPMAAYYAINILGDHWPEAEPAIATDPRAIIEYLLWLANNNKLKTDRWPEAEKTLLSAKNLGPAFNYANYIAHQRWPELEQEFKNRKDQGMSVLSITGSSDRVRQYQKKFNVDLGVA